MISKSELGRRLREARSLKGMTLKQLDKSSGFSATHISEIERGKTSPTIGALIRIANALGKEPSYFIEEDLLPEIAVTPREKREKITVDNVDGELLTSGIPGGRLYAFVFRLVPGAGVLKLAPQDGEEGGYVLKGSVEFLTGGTSYTLEEGDAIHHSTDSVRQVRAAGDAPAEIILITTRRMRGAGEGEDDGVGPVDGSD